MALTIQIVVNLVGVLVFFFILWKLLKEDYVRETIFSTGFYFLIFGFIGNFVAYYFFPLFWFWGFLLGGIFGFLVSFIRFRYRVNEVLEAFIISLFPWIFLIFFADSIKNRSWFSLGTSIFVVGVIFLFGFLKRKYKSYTWYKSGRVGFAGLSSLIVYFAVRSLIAIPFPFMLSFVGKIEPILSGSVALVVILALYLLSIKKS